MTSKSGQITPPPGLEGLEVPSLAALRRLVYLVGPARGGTTLIHGVLNASPHAVVPQTPSHFLANAWPYRNKVNERVWRQLVTTLPNYFKYPHIVRDLPDHVNKPLGQYVERQLRQKDLFGVYTLYPIIMTASGLAGKKAEDVHCWHDKSNNWRNLPLIRRHFPEARFIFVVRDPRDSVLSNARRAAVKEFRDDQSILAMHDIVDFALYWRLLVQRCLAFTRQHPDICRVVRFEDFVADPDNQLEELLLFATGVKTSKADLENTLSNRGGGASNAAAERYHGISTQPVGRWKEVLSHEQMVLIDTLTGPVSARMGYEPENQGTLRGFQQISEYTLNPKLRAQMALKFAFLNSGIFTI